MFTIEELWGAITGSVLRVICRISAGLSFVGCEIVILLGPAASVASASPCVSSNLGSGRSCISGCSVSSGVKGAYGVTMTLSSDVALISQVQFPSASDVQCYPTVNSGGSCDTSPHS